MRLRVTRTLVETRLHGLDSSREGGTVAGTREILDYAMREIGEVAGPALWETRDDNPNMPPRRHTRTTDSPDQEGQQNSPPTGHIDPVVIQLLNTLTQQTTALAQQQQQVIQQQLLEQHQQQQHHQKAAPVEIEKAFTLIEVTEEKKTEYASYFLKSEASYWWETSRAMEPEGLITWGRFTELFLERYFPDYMRDQMELKFLELKQGNMAVPQYETKFTELARFVPMYVDTEKKKANRFQQGLRSWIRSKLAILELDTYATVVQKTMIAEAESDSYMKERENKKRKAWTSDKGQP
ncbi:hypothetical protein POM88_026252 [Heracleum sosnowskyi]|uniref:Retrotransposon gag domain-containing protein n=1 Tax=Heracleum sosnowskyi TaxID=360622 RepID=A0AAD8I642_9APIA|nr:hypothetical protein POM88_026252 [Heracleum sosnowskyi]